MTNACFQIESFALFEIRRNETTEDLYLCYRPITFEAHQLQIKAKYDLNETTFVNTVIENKDQLLGFISQLDPERNWRSK
jgi:hypothetical protein